MILTLFLTIDYMKNLKWWLFGGCSILSLVISIVTLCSFENYDVDKTSMLMSGFSLFVSVLVGINALFGSPKKVRGKIVRGKVVKGKKVRRK